MAMEILLNMNMMLTLMFHAICFGNFWVLPGATVGLSIWEKHTRNVCANYVRMVDRWRCFLESCWTGRRHWRWTNMCVRFTWAWRLLLLLLDLPPQKAWQKLLMHPRRIPLKPRNVRSSARASSQTRDRCFSTTRGVLDCTSVSFTHSRPQSLILSHQAQFGTHFVWTFR